MTSNGTSTPDDVPQAEVGNGAKKRTSAGASKRRSSMRTSFFARARMSFVRSGGKRGATVEDLRGTTGADFESPARVARAGGYGVGTCCGLMGGGGFDEESKSARKVRFVLVKGPSCFIFSNESSPSPKYAISLAHKRAEVQQTVRGHTTVHLETTLGDIEYKFTFDSNETAERFANVVTHESLAAEQEIARKRLGHEHLLNKRASARYAEKVAEKKIKDQPDAPVSADEVMAAMPGGPAMQAM